jgi:AraC-like DNA-binding protein
LQLGVHDASIEGLLGLMTNAIEAGNRPCALYFDTLAHARAMRFLLYKSRSGDTQNSSAKPLPPRILRRIRDRIEAELNTTLPLESLAKESGYSRAHFLRMFRATTGLTPHQYVLEMRLSTAQQLLRLQQALQLEPRNTLAMEYLAALYYHWLDPKIDSLGNARRSRLTDALHWYERILEIDPPHKFANQACGVIEWERAFELMRSSGSYPRPLPNEEARRSLHAQIAPLLDDSTRNLLRSLEIDPNNEQSMSTLIQVKRAQAYVADTNDEHMRASSEADEWTRKVNQILEAKAEAAGQPWPPGPTATITFRAVPQTSQPGKKPALPPFPPDPQWMIPLGVPPPPPPVKR